MKDLHAPFSPAARREALAVAAALGLVLAAALVLRPAAPSCSGRFFDLGCGEALLHRVPALTSFMPLRAILPVLIFDHSGPASCAAWLLAFSVLWAGALGTLGYRFGGVPGAALALAAAWFLRLDGWFHVPDVNEFTNQAFHTVLFLTLAAVLVWRARAPSLWTDLLSAACLGTCLLYRSDTFLLPIALGLYEFVIVGRLFWRASRGAVLRLTVLPYLALLPWIRMNWLATGRFIPLENRLADCNLVTGVLGLVPTIEGDWRRLTPDPPDPTRAGAVLVWAAAEVLRHPFRYAISILKRLAYVISWHPALWAFALAACWLRRSQAEVRQASVLVAYFLGIHCLMSVQQDYFSPLWPLLCALAASLAVPAALRPPSGETVASRCAALLAQGCAAAVVSLGAFALWTVNAYAGVAGPHAVGQEAALERALAVSPADPWLLSQRARGRMDAGDAAGAAADYETLLRSHPDYPGARSGAAWTRLYAAAPASGAPWEPLDCAQGPEGCFYNAIHYVRDGRRAQARSQLRDALSLWQKLPYIRRELTPQERRAAELLRRDRLGDFADMMLVDQWRERLPATERLALVEELAALNPGDPAPWTALAKQAAGEGDGSLAREAMRRAEAASR